MFSDEPANTKRVIMSIDTGDSPPIRQAPYSVPIGLREEVRAELRKLEDSEIIKQSESMWASPLVLVRKKEGGLRLCVDFRNVTVKEPYYIPAFKEMTEMIGKGRVLSNVDRNKTSFICPFGKFRFVRMPLGLTNAPSVCQRLMDCVLVNCVSFARVYIDDILIVSESWSEHMVHLRRFCEVLKGEGLTCKHAKCVFGKRKLEFLGHIVGCGEGVYRQLG